MSETTDLAAAAPFRVEQLAAEMQRRHEVAADGAKSGNPVPVVAGH